MTTRVAFVSLLTACLSPGCGMDPGAAPVAPSVRQGDVEYRATTAILESFPVQLHATVTMLNRSSARTTLELGSGCPVLLRVYQDQARTALVWDQGRAIACTKQIQIVEIAPGDTAQRSTRTNAREILGDSLPDGRYFLSAFIQVVGSPVVVPAGEADLAVPR